MIPCELDLTSTPFCYTRILRYEIELPPSGKKVDFNSLDDEYFTTPHITDTIPSSPSSHQLTTLNRHQTPRGKSKVKISLCRRKSYQRTYMKDIYSRFNQVRPVVSNLEVSLPKKTPTPKKIGESLKRSSKTIPERKIIREI